MRRPARLVATLALVAATACAGGSTSNDANSSRGQKTDRTDPTGISADDPGCRYIVAGTASRSTTPTVVPEYLVSAVAEPFACYDKVTFTFDAGDAEAADTPPGYTVEYRKPPFGLLRPNDPPGCAVPDDDTECRGISTSTAGFDEAKAVLYVEMSSASTTDRRSPPQLRNCEGNQTYCGNLRLLLKGMHHVVIVEWIQTLPEALPSPTTTTTLAGDLPPPERVVWLIGLDERRPFTVDFARDPVPHVNVLIMR